MFGRRVRHATGGYRVGSGRLLTVLAVVIALVASFLNAADAKPSGASGKSKKSANSVQVSDFGPHAASSKDVAVNGWGDAGGYHVEVGRESAGFMWHEVAALHPAGYDADTWTGYQCLSGDGRFAAVTILPSAAANDPSLRDHGGFAYSIDLSTGVVHPVSDGVGFMYFSPGCSAGTTAVFTLYSGVDEHATQLVVVDLSSGTVLKTVAVTGQVSSAVATPTGLVAVIGASVVSIADDGATKVIATSTGQPFDLQPGPGAAVRYLVANPGSSTATAQYAHAGQVQDLGSGPLTRMHLFAARAGGAILVGAAQTASTAVLSAASVTARDDKKLTRGADFASLDGDALFGADPDSSKVDPVVLASFSHVVRSDPHAAATAVVTTALPTHHPDGLTAGAQAQAGGLQPHGDAAPAGGAPVAPTVPGPTAPGPSSSPSAPAAPSVSPPSSASGSSPSSGGSAPSSGPASGSSAPSSSAPSSSASPSAAAPTKSSVVTAAFNSNAVVGAQAPAAAGTPAAAAQTAAAQAATCAVPRLTTNLQVMQPSPAQVDWAAQMAEQGLLTGGGYTRPAGYANMGLVAYAPNSDFPLIGLSHPSGSAQNTVPRSVFEAIMAQESNFSQASWHAPQGVAGDPLIADYYGAGGGINSINYAGADCGYGVAQVTDGMRLGQHVISAHGQMKVAVDYQENISAGLQILESTWNQLYSAGLTANGGDPKYLENWYFAIWAYNSGIQPSASYNSTGCTPGPSCTGPDGTWGLGWSNNPENPSYPPNRDPYLQDTYADAAHPGNWPYQERVLGWMASPIVRYGAKSYAKPTYQGGQSWVQPAPFASFCTIAGNDCDPTSTNATTPDAGHCMLGDYECWWHSPVTWISNCATTCATSTYAVTTGSTEPPDPDPNPPTCNQDASKVPSGSIIVDDEPSPPANLQGCSGLNWSSNGTFNFSYGTNAAGDPIGAIDTHQLGTGFGGHILFSHTEDGSDPSLINTGTWTPNLPSLQYYKVKIHIPSLGADATNVVYTINPGGGVAPWKIRVNQAWNSEQWVTIGTFAMQNGANVILSNQSTTTDTAGTNYYNYDVAYDAVAFVPQGGTPGQPIGGPPGIVDAPEGSNPAFINCGCATRTAGDPVDTSTGYFGDSFTDLSTAGRGAALKLTRSYAESVADPNGPNGPLAKDGPFGWGWSYSYGLTAATAPGTGNVTITQEDGSAVPFIDTGGTYTPNAPRYDATLTKSGSTYTYTRHGSLIFTFDQSTGRLLSEQDLAGSKAVPQYSTTLAYDAAGHLHTITDPGGRVYTVTWTGNHITEVQDSAGRTVTYVYDANSNLTDVYGIGSTRSPTLNDDDHAQYTYNAAHLMTSMRSPKNYGGPASAVTAMAYDSSERVTTQTDPNGHPTTFTYGPAGGLQTGQTLSTDPSGHKTLDTYLNGELLAETKGYGTADAGTTSYTYDPVTMGISTKVDPDGNVQTFTYDDHGNRTSASNGLGITTNYLYGDHGDLLETIDGNGVATVNQYDQSGHIPAAAAGVYDLTSSTVTQANNIVESVTGNFGPAPTRTTNYYFDDAAHPGDPTRIVDPGGNTSKAAYDTYGDTTSTTDAAGNKTLFGYNTATGQKTTVVSPVGTAAGITATCTAPANGCTNASYDAYGNLTKTTDSLGHTTTAIFDADGDKTSTTDPNNKATTVTYDLADRPVKSTAADSTTQLIDYNPDGTTADEVDGLGHKTTYGYDNQGRRTSRVDADSRTWAMTYDKAGRVISTVDPAGRTTSNKYDAAGQLSSITYSDGVTPNVAMTYDPVGHVLTTTDGTGTSTRSYDVFGELISKSTGAGQVVSYGYDGAGNQSSITYPGQSVPVKQTFDADNRLKTVTDWNNNTTTFGYSPDGPITSVAYPNGVSIANGYNSSDQLTSIAPSGQASGDGLTVGRDPAGQVGSTQPAGAPASTVAYTARETLASTTTSGSATAFAVDAANNPTTVGPLTQAFDPAGQLCWSTTTAVTTPSCGIAPSTASTYTFGSSAQRVKSTPATGPPTTYGYDQSGRLTTYSGPSSSASYTYDASGLRATKTSGGVTTAFTWDDQSLPNLLTDGTNSFIYGPGGLAIEQITASGTSWFVHNQVGSTTALLNATGATVGTYSYTPYGVPTHTGAAGTPLQFTGQYTDAESGLVYLRARYYDPVTAQFLTLDPQVASTHSPYGYVGGNPLNRTDPNGMCGWLCWTIVAAVAAVATIACMISIVCGVAEGAGVLAAEGAAAGGGAAIEASGAAAEGEAKAQAAEGATGGDGEESGAGGGGGSGGKIANSGVKAQSTSELNGTSGCEKVAEGIQSKIGGKIWQADPTKTPLLGTYRGVDSGWAYHQFLVLDGRAYDAYTGEYGQPLEKYEQEFEPGSAVFKPLKSK